MLDKELELPEGAEVIYGRVFVVTRWTIDPRYSQDVTTINHVEEYNLSAHDDAVNEPLWLDITHGGTAADYKRLSEQVAAEAKAAAEQAAKDAEAAAQVKAKADKTKAPAPAPKPPAHK